MQDPKKQQLRTELKQARDTITAADKSRFDGLIHQQIQTLEELISANVVFIYLATAAEVSTRAIIDECLAQRKTILVPKITSGSMVATLFTGWDELEKGQLGILTPVNTTAYTEAIDISITPGLGFSTDGRRIGYGKGYYDSWFSTHPGVKKVALTYECLLRNDIPSEQHDVLVDKIVTEQRIIVPA